MRDFGILNIEPVWEQQGIKLMEHQKPLTEVAVIRDMRVTARNECR